MTDDTIALPPKPEKRPIEGQAGLNCVIWGKGHDDSTLEAYAREAVRLYIAGRVGALSRDGSMTIDALVEGVKGLYPGADRQALRCIALLAAKEPTTLPDAQGDER